MSVTPFNYVARLVGPEFDERVGFNALVPGKVRSSAENLLNRLDTRTARIEAEAKYLGTYPPKTIPTN